MDSEKLNRFEPSLELLIEKNCSMSSRKWLQESCKAIKKGNVQSFYLNFSKASRMESRDPVHPPENKSDLLLPDAVRIEAWTRQSLLRIYLLLAIPSEKSETLAMLVQNTFECSDEFEAVDIGLALPLLPFAAQFSKLGKEMLRTNMQSVFKSIAWNNPFPRDHFDEASWNQMVLKTIFFGLSLKPVIGLKERNNANLKGMLADFAAEREKAGREIPQDLIQLAEI